MQISTEQQNKLATWAEQRDFILKELLELKKEKQILTKINQETELLTSDIVLGLNRKLGTVDISTHLDKYTSKWEKEKEVILREIANLEINKDSFIKDQKEKAFFEIKEELKSLSKEKDILLNLIKKLNHDKDALIEKNQILVAEKLSLDQQNKLATWAEQRDSILNNISSLTDQQKSLEKENINSVNSLNEKEERKKILIGEIKQLEKQEEKRKNLISVELDSLNTQKNELENSVEKQTLLLESFIAKKDLVFKLTQELTSVNESLAGKNKEIEVVASRLQRSAEKNIFDSNNLFDSLKKDMRGLLDSSVSASESANVILEKLPRWIFELQRPVSLKKENIIRKVKSKK